MALQILLVVQPCYPASSNSDEVIVQLRDGRYLSGVDGSLLARSMGAVMTKQVPNHPNLILLKKNKAVPMDQFLKTLQDNPDVEYAEQNVTLSIPDPKPDKVYPSAAVQAPFSVQGSPTDPDLTWGYEDIKADLIPRCPDSAPVVAVIDTGVDYTHPELAGRVILGHDFHNEDDDPMDDHGHGTHVSGIIAAAANNGAGSAGISDRSRILAIKVLGADGSGSNWNVIQGIYAAADHPEVRVINLSLGTWVGTWSFHNAVDYAVGQDKLIVAAAGNSNSNSPYFPAYWSQYSVGVMAVGANDQQDCKAVFSNYGNWVTICAPGVSILSCLPNGRYGSWSGTSMATPFVVGAAARLLAVNPKLRNHELAAILEGNTDSLTSDGTCWPNDGSNFGHLNLFQTLNSIPGGVQDTEPPIIGIQSPSAGPEYTTDEGIVSLSGTATDNIGVVQVTWINDRGGLGSASGTDSWQINGAALYEGENRITVTASDSAGNQGQATLLVSYLPAPEGTFTLNLQVSARQDDSAETADRSTLPLAYRTYVGKGHINGFHFKKVAIPQGTVIISAKLETYCWGYADKNISINYTGEAADNAGSFTAAKSDLSSRPTTATSLTDQPAAWTKNGFNSSPELRAILQEIVNRPGWQPGSSVNLFILDRGSSSSRGLSLFDQRPQNGAKLTITYRNGEESPDQDTLPPEVHITSPQAAGEYRIAQSSLDLSGTADDNVGVIQVNWESERGESGTAQGTTEWYIHAIALHPGTNTITVRAEDAAGNLGEARLTAVYEPAPDIRSVDLKIKGGNDDSLEKTYNGAAYTKGGTMYIGSGRINGFRFANVPIPRGSTIVTATMRLYCYLYGTQHIILRYAGEATPNSRPFLSSRFDLSSRSTTKAQIVDTPSAWTNRNYNASPDLAPIIQEIINKPGWKQSNPLSLLVKNNGGAGIRLITAFEGNSSHAAILHVEFIAP
jgi:thermitase